MFHIVLLCIPSTSSILYTPTMPTYKDSGVDINAADGVKKVFKKSLNRGDPRVLNSVGAFASLVQGKFKGYKDPVLVLKTEEPGSKQKLAFEHGFVPSICFDTINHLINDIVVLGALPLYVQDAIICGKLEAIVTKIVEGFAKACEEQGCVLVGGETSEQPGVLEPGTYILVANIVGIVERSKVIDGAKIEEGDTVIGIASNGLHTNGYSLVRSLLAEHPKLLHEKIEAEESFLSALMKPHRCYLNALKDLFTHPGLHGLAHITGGGIGGNLNRILPPGLDAEIDLAAIDIPAIFKRIHEIGAIPDSDMLQTFNMGVGLTLVIDPDAVPEIQNHIAAHNMNSTVVGSITKGKGDVIFRGTLRY